MIRLNPVVGVPISLMPGRWQQLRQHHRVRRCPVSHDLTRRYLGGADGALKEPARCHRVTPRRDEHVDDLACLVDRAVDIVSGASDLHIRLVHSPAVPNGMAAGPGRLDQQRREPVDPPGDGDVVDLDAALGEQLLDIP